MKTAKWESPESEFVILCVRLFFFHLNAMKLGLYIVSNIFVAKQIVVIFTLAEEYEGSLLLFYVFIIF